MMGTTAAERVPPPPHRNTHPIQHGYKPVTRETAPQPGSSGTQGGQTLAGEKDEETEEEEEIEVRKLTDAESAAEMDQEYTDSESEQAPEEDESEEYGTDNQSPTSPRRSVIVKNTKTMKRNIRRSKRRQIRRDQMSKTVHERIDTSQMRKPQTPWWQRTEQEKNRKSQSGSENE